MRSATSSEENATKPQDIQKKEIYPLISSLTRDLDDSSDEEDNAVEEDTIRLTSNLAKNNPDITASFMAMSGIMEMFGRNIIYKTEVRTQYLRKKASLASESQQELTTAQYGEKATDKMLRLLERAFKKALKVTHPDLEDINDDLPDINFSQYAEDRELFIRKILKQAHREEIIPFFQTLATLALERIEIKLKEKSFIREARKEKQEVYEEETTLTSEKVLAHPKLKEAAKKIVMNVIKRAKRKVAEKEENEKEETAIDYLEDKLQFSNFRDTVFEYIKNTEPELHGKAKNTATKHCLKAWIDDSLKSGKIDRPRSSYKNSPLQKIIEQAEEENITTIISCKKSEKEFTKEETKQALKEQLFQTFVLAFCSNLHSYLQQKKLLPLERATIPKMSVDTEMVSNPSDFFAKEHLSHRSATRQSREYAETSTTCISFDPSKNITVQKEQSIGQATATINEEIDNIPYRGTLKEEVYNLGNYDSVKKILEKFGVKLIEKGIVEKNKIDKYLADLIRDCFKEGISIIDTEKYQNLRNALGKRELREFKQRIAETVELLFGTETWRSPASIIETNMMLDLIMAEKKKFTDAFTNRNNGGELSYTMKSAESESNVGGVALGRELSTQCNETLTRKHKYGGPRANKQSAEFHEYIQRKGKLAETWLREIERQEEGLPRSDASFLHALERNREKWLGRPFYQG